MSKSEVDSHVYLHANRLVLDAQALAWATLLIAAAAGAASCAGTTAEDPPVGSSGGATVMGPGVCAVFVSGGSNTGGSSEQAALGGSVPRTSVASTGGYGPGVCATGGSPVISPGICAAYIGGGTTGNSGTSSGDGSTGGFQGGGIC